MTAHKRFCANCRKPDGRIIRRIWFPPLRLGQSRPGPEWSVCCFNPVGCGCLSIRPTPHLDAVKRERDEALAERDQAVESCEHWIREWNLATAELEQLRAAHRPDHTEGETT